MCVLRTTAYHELMHAVRHDYFANFINHHFKTSTADSEHLIQVSVLNVFDFLVKVLFIDCF